MQDRERHQIQLRDLEKQLQQSKHDTSQLKSDFSQYRQRSED
jgi:molecular chaperone GrpE (heat shock protein)